MGSRSVTDILVRVADNQLELPDGHILYRQAGQVLDARNENNRRVHYLELAGILANPDNRSRLRLRVPRLAERLILAWRPHWEAVARECAKDYFVSDEVWSAFVAEYDAAFGPTHDEGARQLEVWPWTYHDEIACYSLRVENFDAEEAFETITETDDIPLVRRMLRRLTGRSNLATYRKYAVDLSLVENGPRLTAIKDPHLHVPGRTDRIFDWRLLRKDTSAT